MPILITLIRLAIHFVNVLTFALVLTGGGPNNATQTMGLTMYRMGFVDFRLGPANALAILVSGVQPRTHRRAAAAVPRAADGGDGMNASWRARALARRAINVVVTALVCAAALFPILWGLSTSLKPASGILEYPPQLLPAPPTLEHYAQLFTTGIHKYIVNSAIVSTLTVALCVFLAALAAYALARFEFRGKGFVMFVIVAVMSIPLPSLTVPTFTFLALIGLTNTLAGLVLLYTAYQIPLAVWVLYGYFRTIPTEYENAAMVDGYTRLAALRKVVLPLSAPGLIAAGLFTLTFAWNDFVVAVAMNSSDDVRTLPVAIYNYLGFFGREWGPLTAAAMVSIVPVIAVFVIFQKYFLSGMTGGGVKG